MKKFAIVVCLCITSSVFAQKVTVSKKSEKIKGESAEGYQTELEGTKEDVASAWNKYVKDNYYYRPDDSCIRLLTVV